MGEPDDSRPMFTDDLDACAVCGKPATGWADDQTRRAYGACGAAHRSAIALWPGVMSVDQSDAASDGGSHG